MKLTKEEILSGNFKDVYGNVVKLNEAEILMAKKAQADLDLALKVNGAETGLGAEMEMTTLTVLLKTISQQKFYEVNIEDFLPIEIDGGWAKQLLQVREFLTADIDEGWQENNVAQAKIPVAEAVVDGKYIPVVTWLKKIQFTIEELKQAALVNNYSLIAGKERSRKKSFDLGLQKVSFLGNKIVKGLLNQTDIAIDTTTIPKSLKEMNFNEINVFVANVLEKYRKNCNRTAYPNVFLIPESDYNGLSAQVSPQFPLKNKFQMLQEAFDLIARKHVAILPCVYADQEYNKLGLTRYALYNKDMDSIKLVKAIDYTPTMFNNIDGWNLVNTAFARVGGVFVNRPQEILYFDRTEDSSSSI